MYVVTIFPYVMLTVLLIRGCTLEGASLGIEFYLNPDFDRLTDGTASDSLYISFARQASSFPLQIMPQSDLVFARQILSHDISWEMRLREIYSHCPK